MKTKILCFLAILFSFYFTNTFAWNTYSDVSYQTNDKGELQIKMQDGNIITHTATATQGLMSGLSNGSMTEADIYKEANKTNSAANSIFDGTSTLSDYGITQGAGTAGHTIAATTQTNTNLGFVCENGRGLSVTKDVPNTPTPTYDPPTTTYDPPTPTYDPPTPTYDPPTPVVVPPTPVVTYGSSTSGESCSYIASWSENWSTCGITGGWNANGSINCKQTLSWIPNSATASWSCTTDSTYVDGVLAGSSTSCNGSCPANAPQPGGATETKTITMALSTPTTQTNNAYANNSDTNKVQVVISGSTNQNRAIVGWGNAGKFSGFEDNSNFPSDLVAKTGKALAINHSQDVTSVNPNGILVEIPVTSKTPFEGKGKISFQAGGVPFILNNVQYSFKKPFVGFIQTWNYVSDSWDGVTSLGTENRYRLGLNKKSSLDLSGLTQYTLNNFASEIQPNGDGLEIQSKSVSGTTLSSKTGTEFTARINTSESATELNNTPGLQINLPIISYQLGGQTVKYYLSEQEESNDTTPIKTTGSEFLGVRVIGGIQGAGKSEFTGQQANISNLYNSDQRTILRKNAYNYVKNMTNRQILNGVKYVKGDEKISNITPDVETLVVVDGNVIFDNNFIPTKLKGIIVLKDNYDVMSGYAGEGNVYITPNVTQINAIIYADGGIISADNGGNPYTQDSIERTQSLKNQLIFNGSVFTRNTIGGAILAGGSYILPGGTKTNDFNKAMIYDLNYIRRANVGCDKNNNTYCNDTGEYKDPFVIQYDSRVQLSPPKLFEQ